MQKIGEFELLVILAILRQDKSPYANDVRRDLEAHAQRKVTRGALYRTLDRLQEKGLVAWELEASQVPERGGHPMRKLHVTSHGLAAARGRRAVLERFFESLDPAAKAEG